MALEQNSVMHLAMKEPGVHTFFLELRQGMAKNIRIRICCHIVRYRGSCSSDMKRDACAFDTTQDYKCKNISTHMCSSLLTSCFITSLLSFNELAIDTSPTFKYEAQHVQRRYGYSANLNQEPHQEQHPDSKPTAFTIAWLGSTTKSHGERSKASTC